MRHLNLTATEFPDKANAISSLMSGVQSALSEYIQNIRRAAAAIRVKGRGIAFESDLIGETAAENLQLIDVFSGSGEDRSNIRISPANVQSSNP